MFTNRAAVFPKGQKNARLWGSFAARRPFSDQMLDI
jgi:hypothetical protein